MEKFVENTGLVAPLDRVNVDTDQIIPKQFLKRIERTGFGKFAFYDWRYLEDGVPNPDFILNDPKFDILNPSFTINSDNEKISVKANKGNFINKDLILLKKNVSFVSDKFEIYTEEVTFNKIEQTANSSTNSQFISEGTLIKSEGFSILQQGDIILFDGKTSIILN